MDLQKKKVHRLSRKQNSQSPITKIMRSRSETRNKGLYSRTKVNGKYCKIEKNKVISQKLQDVKKNKSASEIVQMTSSMDIQHLTFDQLWNRLQSIIDGYVKFVIFIPQSCNQIGQQVLKDGNFILTWLKIMEKSDYILMQVLCKHVQDKFLPKIQKQQKNLSAYLNVKQQLEDKISITPIKGTQSLKRTSLNISLKKEQLKQNQLNYSKLEQYITPSNYSHYKKIQNIRKRNKFLLSALEIQKIYTLNQVQVIGVVKEYGQKFALILVKDNKMKQQGLCIVVTSTQVYQIQEEDQIKNIILDMKKQFKIWAYLELDGRKTGQIWVNSIPSQK